MNTLIPDEPRYPKEQIISELYKRLDILRNIMSNKTKDDFDMGVNYMASVEAEWIADLLDDIERTI